MCSLASSDGTWVTVDHLPGVERTTLRALRALRADHHSDDLPTDPRVQIRDPRAPAGVRVRRRVRNARPRRDLRPRDPCEEQETFRDAQIEPHPRDQERARRAYRSRAPRAQRPRSFPRPGEDLSMEPVR